MLEDLNIRTEVLPGEMRLLLGKYPRGSWDSHPGFKEKTRGWLNAHRSFRQLATLVRGDTEDYLDRKLAPEEFAQRLSTFGNVLVGNLHGHHNWEDRSYFPELSAADPRFDHGLEILEQDHAVLDRVLDEFSGTANRAIKLVQLDESQSREEAGRLHPVTEAIDTLLDRHLSDEEELAVPIILHHRLRG